MFLKRKMKMIKLDETTTFLRNTALTVDAWRRRRDKSGVCRRWTEEEEEEEGHTNGEPRRGDVLADEIFNRVQWARAFLVEKAADGDDDDDDVAARIGGLLLGAHLCGPLVYYRNDCSRERYLYTCRHDLVRDLKIVRERFPNNPLSNSTSPAMGDLLITVSRCYVCLARRTAEALAEERYELNVVDAVEDAMTLPEPLDYLERAVKHCKDAAHIGDHAIISRVCMATIQTVYGVKREEASPLVREIAPSVCALWPTIHGCFGKDKEPADPAVYEIARALASLVKSRDVLDEDRFLLPPEIAKLKKKERVTSMRFSWN